jgi:hypothetical protein
MLHEQRVASERFDFFLYLNVHNFVLNKKTLFALPQFREEFNEQRWEQHHRECREREPAKCWQCQTGKLAVGLLSGKHSVRPDDKTGVSTGVAPRMWKQLATRGSLFEGA